MRTRNFLRRLSSACLLLATLVLPGTAVTHGLAHQQEHAHVADHHDTVDDHHRPGTSAQSGVVVSVPDHGQDHPHPDLDRAIRGRADAPFAVPRVPAALPAARITVALSAAPTPRDLPAPGDRARGRPPSLRAPPSC